MLDELRINWSTEKLVLAKKIEFFFSPFGIDEKVVPLLWHYCSTFLHKRTAVIVGIIVSVLPSGGVDRAGIGWG